ncbi:MAG: alanine racemase [Clostridiales bacterium]|nr:alanine racemase [Clostridiales bacterium]
MRPTVAEIDLGKLRHNIFEIKKQLSPQTSLMAIVKANAYGHGIVDIAKHALRSGATALGVAFPEEGVAIRQAGIDCDILVLSGIGIDQIDIVVDYNLSVCLFTLDMACLINQQAQKKGKYIKTHIKIDSGMGRIGIRDKSEALQLCNAIAQLKCLRLEGIFTHFACAEDCDHNYSDIQLNRFRDIVAVVNKADLQPKWIHAANTDSIFNFPESHFNMVRAGIGIYGYSSQCLSNASPDLEPILSWHTKIVYLKKLKIGSGVSYGRTFIAKEPVKVATLPVGYGDGYNRLLSNKGWVLIKGIKAPILGNICMDQMMVDVTNIPGVGIGDKVVLVGQQGNEKITAADLAKLCGTISYEILSNINMRVPRKYIG